MSTKIAKTFRFPETLVGPAGRPTTFGRNLDCLRKLKVGFSERFAQALNNPRHTLTRFLSDFDLGSISRDTGIAGIEAGRWLTSLSQAFEQYCQESPIYRITHEEVNPSIRGRRFALDYKEPQSKNIQDLLFQVAELFLDKRFAETEPLIEAALDNMRERDLAPLDRLEILETSAVMYIGMGKQPEGLELLKEMSSLFSRPGIDRFSLPRFFDFMILALWETGNRPLAYQIIDLSTDIAEEMILILEMGSSVHSLMKMFSLIPQQLRNIRSYLEGETAPEAIRVVARVDRLLERTEALQNRYSFDQVGPQRKGRPN